MKQPGHIVRKPELDAPSLQSMEGHLQASMEVWVNNNNKMLLEYQNYNYKENTTIKCSNDYRGSSACSCRDPCRFTRHSQVYIKLQTMKMSDRQDLSTVMTVISANIEGLTASKASMLPEMCKREHCHCLCLQKTHRAPHFARPKITGMTLVAELPHIKYGSAVLI